MTHENTSAPTGLRLQVFLSRSGVCSRRRALQYIIDGKVTVNNRVVREPSTAIVSGADRVSLNGIPVTAASSMYIMFHKPGGCVTTAADRHAKKIIFDLLPQRFRGLHPVGRLDKDTEGLLLLTNDGELTNQLTHPRFNINKTYYVRIKGTLQPADTQRLEHGIVLDGQKTAAAKIADVRAQTGTTEFCLTIHEGRKRQIRVMLSALGHTVVYLKRIAQGPLLLGDLKKGAWRSLTSQEIAALKKRNAAHA